MKYDIKNLTLQEKIDLLTGRNGWQLSNANGKLPDVFLSDGPHGVRMLDISLPDKPVKPATAMPALAMIANSWDINLAYRDGEIIADDMIELEADVLLAPGVNIKRTPLCGRNFEYFSEDPFLSGNLAKAYIRGVQSKGIGTSLKHFALNNREFERYTQSSEVDERSLREIYTPAFEIALEAKPWTVMCSYNPVNGVWASENRKLLNGLLREEFGYNGLIVSDWGAVHHSGKAVKATLDVRMPYDVRAVEELQEGLQEGWLTEEEIDERVLKVLELMEKKEDAKALRKITTTKEERHQAAVEIASDCIVLLKNEDDILPVRSGNIKIIGYRAKDPITGGGGSAFVSTNYKGNTLTQELSNRLKDKANISFVEGYNDHQNAASPLVQYTCAALTEAYDADTVVLCVGTNKLSEGEEFDRVSMRLSALQEELILNTAKYNKNVVVVVYAGSAIDMSPWIDKVKAVVFAGFLGEAANEAIANVLSGEVNPSGKISETFPLCIEDTSTVTSRGNGFVERYNEGIFVGYRWFDAKGKEVLFHFGHGLSYSKFEYSDLAIEKINETTYNVLFTIKNSSNRDGKEVAQLYVRDVFSSVERPEKELKGFHKVALKAGESKKVKIPLDARSFSFWSSALDKWYVENGIFEIMVGASSKDIRLSQAISIKLSAAMQYSLPFEK